MGEKVIFCAHSYFLSFSYIKLWKSQTGIYLSDINAGLCICFLYKPGFY